MLVYLKGEPTKYDQLDICSYTRKILTGLLMVLFVFFVITVIANLSVQFMFGVMFSIMYWSWIFSPVAEAILFVIALGSAVAGIYFGIGYIGTLGKKIKHSKTVNDGFIGHAYKSWKHKYCVPVVINYDE